ncbi:conjugal transfer protein TraP [Klebsiella electrica]
MAKSLLSLILSSLRWINWLIQYAVVYPLAMMMLLIVAVFWTGKVTPGQMLVNTIESVQREGYVIKDCTGPASRGELNADAVKPLLPPVLPEALWSLIGHLPAEPVLHG